MKLESTLSSTGQYVAQTIGGLFNPRVSVETIWANILASISLASVFLLLSVPFSETVFDRLFDIFLIFWVIHIFLTGIFGHWGRLHDNGRSGWWWFIHLIPYIGSFGMWAYSALSSGDEGPNKYGMPQEPIKLKPWLMFAVASFSLAIITLNVRDSETEAEAKSISEYEGLVLNDSVLAALQDSENRPETNGYVAAYSVASDSFEATSTVDVSKQCEWRTKVMLNTSVLTADGPRIKTYTTESIEPILDGTIFFRETESTKGTEDADPVNIDTKVYRVDSIANETWIKRLDISAEEESFSGEALFPAAFHQKVVSLQRNSQANAIEVTLKEFDAEAIDFFTETQYRATKILLDDSYTVWEWSSDEDVFLTTTNGVDIWGASKSPEQDPIIFSLDHYIPVEGECLSEEAI